MEKKIHTSPAKHAQMLMKNKEKSTIITSVFNLFSFDSLMRSSVDPSRLDKLIEIFLASDCTDEEILTHIITLVQDGKNASTAEEKNMVKDICAYIDAHLFEDLTTRDIADALNVSYYYLCHFFKQNTGGSLSEYIHRKLLEKAVPLLIGTDRKVSDVAISCGFNSVSYFTELFTKYMGRSPTAFRAVGKNACFHSFYDLDDIRLAVDLDSMRFLPAEPELLPRDGVQTYPVMEPFEEFSFLHEAAIIEFKGVLYASWYNCASLELMGYTPINGKRSYDGGKTWSALEILAEDKNEKILYCPPVYGISNGKLYLFMNQLVAPDHVHALDLYVLNEQTGKFEFLWSRPIPFKLNTNMLTLPNGKLMLPGRIGELDRFPNTPAVLICDCGDPEGQWRVIKVSSNGDLPDGTKLVHPETSAICCGGTLYLFCRNDQRRVPLVYVSDDMGESWSATMAHDIPYVRSKIYCGTLSDGRNYLIANADNFADKYDRSRLNIYFTAPDSTIFEKKMILFDTDSAPIPDTSACHYPSAIEWEGKLYIITTRSANPRRIRGAVLFVVDLSTINS